MKWNWLNRSKVLLFYSKLFNGIVIINFTVTKKLRLFPYNFEINFKIKIYQCKITFTLHFQNTLAPSVMETENFRPLIY